jgi:transposase
MSNQYSTQDLDHLGIVAGVCQQIGLIEQINARVPDTGRKVSVGQAVQAMVLNGLGFVGRALYLTPEFYRTKPLDLLIGEGIRPTT